MVAHSPYFAALLDTNQFREVTTSNRGKLTFITLSNVLAETFALLLKFIYTGTTEVCIQCIVYVYNVYTIHVTDSISRYICEYSA